MVETESFIRFPDLNKLLATPGGARMSEIVIVGYYEGISSF